MLLLYEILILVCIHKVCMYENSQDHLFTQCHGCFQIKQQRRVIMTKIVWSTIHTMRPFTKQRAHPWAIVSSVYG